MVIAHGCLILMLVSMLASWIGVSSFMLPAYQFLLDVIGFVAKRGFFVNYIPKLYTNSPVFWTSFDRFLTMIVLRRERDTRHEQRFISIHTDKRSR